MQSRKVFLVHPGSNSTGFVYPLGLVYIARYLNDMGIEVEILQFGIENFSKLKLDKYLFVGISVTSGYMIKNALEVSRRVKAFDKDIPIILGGVHPSILPEQTLEHPLIDMVVMGEGEETIQEVAAALIENKDMAGIKGIGYKDKNGNIIINPKRDYMNMDSIPIDLPYKLLKEPFKHASVMPIHTSRGCPYRCSFCFNTGLTDRKYRMKSADRVVEEIKFLIKTYGITNFTFDNEDEFFINIQRAVEIFERVLKENIKIRWSTFCRFDTFDMAVKKYGESFVKLLKDSGVRSIYFGAESGSQYILDNVMKKDIKVEQILSAVDLLKKYDIPHIVSFVFCIPGERPEDLRQTMQLIDKISENNKSIFIPTNIMTPLPRTQILDVLVKDYNYKPPETLEGWGNYKIPFDCKDITWHSKEYLETCDRIKKLDTFPFYIEFKSFAEYKKCIYNSDRLLLIGYFFAKLARWRYTHNNYRFFMDVQAYSFIFNTYNNARNILVDRILKKYLSKKLFVFLKNIFGNKEW